ncbi:MAG TPA: cell division protein ZapA [Chitinophagaceae bacterium]
MKELIPVNIVIAERNYRLKIDPADEQSLRKTVKLINDKVYEFKNSFAGKDMQDYVAMVLLWFATEQGKAAPGSPDMEDTIEKLESIEHQLDKVLAEINTEELPG